MWCSDVLFPPSTRYSKWNQWFWKKTGTDSDKIFVTSVMAVGKTTERRAWLVFHLKIESYECLNCHSVQHLSRGIKTLESLNVTFIDSNKQYTWAIIRPVAVLPWVGSADGTFQSHPCNGWIQHISIHHSPPNEQLSDTAWKPLLEKEMSAWRIRF